MVEEDQQKFKREFGKIKAGNPDHKVINSYIQWKILKIFMTQGKKLLIYSIVSEKLGLKLFTNQNKMKMKEKDLRY